MLPFLPHSLASLQGLDPKRPVLYLEAIQDPGNLGTILRTAAAANAAAVAPPRKKLRRLTVVLFFDDIDPPPVRMLIFRQSVSKQVISSLLWMFRAANEHSSCSRFGAVDV